MDTRLDNLEKNFNVKFKEIENELQRKVSLFEFNELKERIAQLEKGKQEQDCLAIIKESYEKRFNILVHSLLEISSNVWEKPTETLEHVHKFIKDDLLISNPKSLPLVNYYRLPQQPIFKFGRKTIRPIIIVLTNAADKQKIFGNLKNLKSYRKSLNLNPLFSQNTYPRSFNKSENYFCLNSKKLEE